MRRSAAFVTAKAKFYHAATPASQAHPLAVQPGDVGVGAGRGGAEDAAASVSGRGDIVSVAEVLPKNLDSVGESGAKASWNIMLRREPRAIDTEAEKAQILVPATIARGAILRTPKRPQAVSVSISPQDLG